jgi:hypothetical protein
MTEELAAAGEVAYVYLILKTNITLDEVIQFCLRPMLMMMKRKERCGEQKLILYR